jgi:hypothetical protein
VSRVYDDGTITALKNVDLQIEVGDCMAIVGDFWASSAFFSA